MATASNQLANLEDQVILDQISKGLADMSIGRDYKSKDLGQNCKSPMIFQFCKICQKYFCNHGKEIR